MVTRRKFMATVGAGSLLTLAGCGETKGNFKLTDIGVIEKGKSIAAFVEAINITDSPKEFELEVAAYDEDGVRVSHWHYVDRNDVQPGATVRAYHVFESGDSGWADTNDLGQVVDSHTAQARIYDGDGGQYGPEDIGSKLN